MLNFSLKKNHIWVKLKYKNNFRFKQGEEMKKVLILLSAILIYSMSFASIYNYEQIVDKEEVIKYKSGIVLIFNSKINWSEDYIEVKVEEERVIKDSVEMIERYNVLKLEAINRAAMIIDNINIDSDYTVKGYKQIKPSFSKKIDMFIKGVEIVDRNYKNGVVSCIVEIPIAGDDDSITSLILDEYNGAFLKKKLEFIAAIFSQKLYAEDNTGLIIDARKVKITPAVLPKVVTKKETVYDPKKGNKDDISKNGAVQYIVVGNKVDKAFLQKESLTGKEELKRTGTNPKIIEAYGVNGKIKTDVVISQNDAKLLKNSEAVKKGKVTIIVDARVGGIIGRKIGDYEIIVVKGF